MTLNSCGELRLIYRLTYNFQNSKTKAFSRLPVTAQVHFNQSSDWKLQSCVKLASLWLELEKNPAHWVSQFVLVKELAGLLKQKNIQILEFNLQSERWPSTVKPDLGGYGEYDMWAFKWNSTQTSFEPGSLENTPDTRLLLQDSQLKDELLKFLLQDKKLNLIDLGVIKIPEKFLAKRAISYSLHGSARLANRPFSQIFSATDFSSVNFDSYKFIKSPSALIKRLDDMTCMGCHQSRSIAGFHFVGNDSLSTDKFNSVFFSMSPHGQADRARRYGFLKSLSEGNPLDLSRGFSERDPAEKLNGEGAACGRGDPSFIQWTCAPSLECSANDRSPTDLVGRCQPIARYDQIAGSSCQQGSFSQSGDPTLESIPDPQNYECAPNRICEPSQGGFPGGMCTGDCKDLLPGEICGPVPRLKGLHSCLTSEKKPLKECLKIHSISQALRGCDQLTPCREDLICARSDQKDKGVCLPPYFLYQLRLDGHPSPSGALPSASPVVPTEPVPN